MVKHSIVLAGAAAMMAMVVGMSGFPAKESRAGAFSPPTPAFDELAAIELEPALPSSSTPWAQLGAERRAVARLAAARSTPAPRSSGGVGAYVVAAEAAVFASGNRHAAQDVANRD